MAGLLTDAEDFRNRERRAIQRKAMAGRDARLSEDEKRALERRMPLFREQGMATERAIGDVATLNGMLADPEKSLSPGPAIREAIRDPSIATVANAGLQTAVGAGAPKVALGLLAGGYGTAAAKDAGMLDASANAQTVRQSNAAANAAKAGAAAEVQKLQAQTEASRQAAAIEAEREKSRLALDKATREQEEYNRAVGKAETLRNDELARDRRFSETAVGKVYDKTGGAAAFLAPFAVGAINRVGAKAGGLLSRYAIPFAEGAAAAYGVNSLPLYYDAYGTEASNPTKQAYSVYGRELPAGHPRKEEALRYAGPEDKGGLPDANPVRTTAQRELNDGLWKRLGMSAIEGTMAPLGYTAANIPRRMASKVGEMVEGVSTLPGRSATGYARGMTDAAQAQAGLVNARNAIPAPAPRMPMQPPPAPPEVIPPAPSPMPLAPPRQAQTFNMDPPAPSPAAPATRNRFDPSVYGVGAVGAGAGAAAMSDRAEADPAVLAELVRRGKLPPEVLRPYLGLLAQ